MEAEGPLSWSSNPFSFPSRILSDQVLFACFGWLSHLNYKILNLDIWKQLCYTVTSVHGFIYFYFLNARLLIYLKGVALQRHIFFHYLMIRFLFRTLSKPLVCSCTSEYQHHLFSSLAWGSPLMYLYFINSFSSYCAEHLEMREKHWRTESSIGVSGGRSLEEHCRRNFYGLFYRSIYRLINTYRHSSSPFSHKGVIPPPLSIPGVWNLGSVGVATVSAGFVSDGPKEIRRWSPSQ